MVLALIAIGVAGVVIHRRRRARRAAAHEQDGVAYVNGEQPPLRKRGCCRKNRKNANEREVTSEVEKEESIVVGGLAYRDEEVNEKEELNGAYTVIAVPELQQVAKH